jgi:hypothetical protein
MASLYNIITYFGRIWKGETIREIESQQQLENIFLFNFASNRFGYIAFIEFFAYN